MRVLVLDTKPFNPNRYIVRGIYDALERHPRVSRVVLGEYRNALALTAREPFDVLLALDGEEARNVILPRLAAAIPKRAIWFTEDPYELGKNREVAALFDLVISNDAESAAAYEPAARHLPLAADPALQDLPVREDCRYDVFFCGTAWPNRVEFLTALRERRPDLRFRLELVSNPVLDRHFAKAGVDFPRSAGLAVRDVARLANQSRVTLVLPRRFSGTPGERQESDTPGPRLFEGALAGACQLVENSQAGALSRLYEPGRDFVAFSTVDECATAIDGLCAADDRRRQIGQAAQAHTRENHLYDHRVDRILGWLEEEGAGDPVGVRPAQERPKVLVVTHNLTVFGHFGGAEVYLDQLRREMRRYDPMFWARDSREGFGRRYLLYDRDLNGLEDFVPAMSLESGHLSHPELERRFQEILVEHEIDCVFFSHLLGFPPTLPMVARALGRPSLYMTHDFYAVCHRFNLMGTDDRYCAIPERSEAVCDDCLHTSIGLAPGSQAQRRRFYRESLEAVDGFVASSESTRKIYEAMIPTTRGRTHVHPCPVAVPRAKPAPVVGGTAEIEVALIGNFSPQKGAATSLEIMEATAELPIRFHVFGRVDPPYVRPLGAFGDRVVVHGPYPPEQPPPEYACCRMALFLSPWPETFNITLSEVSRMGMVPVVARIGAPAERVVHGETGFVVEPGAAAPVVRLLSEVVAAPEQLERMGARLRTTELEAPSDYAAWVEDRLDELPRPPRLRETRVRGWRTLSIEELGVWLQSQVWANVADSDQPGALGEISGPGGAPRGPAYYRRRFREIRDLHGLRVALRIAGEKAVELLRS